MKLLISFLFFISSLALANSTPPPKPEPPRLMPNVEESKADYQRYKKELKAYNDYLISQGKEPLPTN